jgi:uncharacterized damage-inducible protein DinB
MDEIRSLRDEIRRSLFGDAWHGPAVLETLASFTAAEAAARPIPTAHPAWEIALHVLAWIEEVTRRVQGGAPGDPERGDWPQAPAPEERAWARLQEEIARAHTRLDEVLAEFRAAGLNQPVGSAEHASAADGGTTFALMLHGLAQHNAYHGGQLVLVRRAITGAA